MKSRMYIHLCKNYVNLKNCHCQKFNSNFRKYHFKNYHYFGQKIKAKSQYFSNVVCGGILSAKSQKTDFTEKLCT